MTNTLNLLLNAGEHPRDKCPVSVNIPVGYAKWRFARLIEADTKKPVPCQIMETSNGIRLTWMVNGLKARSSKTYVVKRADAALPAPGVHVEDSAAAGRVNVTVGGKLFTSYHYSPQWVRPFLYPVIGPHGVQVTRNWPILDGVEGEHKDHVHHKSIWVAYGDCSKVDNWSEEKGHGWQRHRTFRRLSSGPVFGEIVAKNDWCASNGRKQFEEIREMRFYAIPGGERLFDIDITFRMTEGLVVFRDTKEGGLVSVRVASSMDVRNGGAIQNGYGGINEGETWGKKAPWCDYSGLVDGKHVGIAVLDHDRNPRYPTEWHVRDYGLMTANCFAWNHYRPEDKLKGDMTFKKGSVTRWRYRIYIHKGDAPHADVTGCFLQYVAPPKVTFE